jgi:hypothetical protein
MLMKFFSYLYRTYTYYNFKFDPKIYLFYILVSIRERKLLNFSLKKKNIG